MDIQRLPKVEWTSTTSTSGVKEKTLKSLGSDMKSLSVKYDLTTEQFKTLNTKLSDSNKAVQSKKGDTADKGDTISIPAFSSLKQVIHVLTDSLGFQAPKGLMKTFMDYLIDESTLPSGTTLDALTNDQMFTEFEAFVGEKPEMKNWKMRPVDKSNQKKPNRKLPWKTFELDLDNLKKLSDGLLQKGKAYTNHVMVAVITNGSDMIAVGDAPGVKTVAGKADLTNPELLADLQKNLGDMQLSIGGKPQDFTLLADLFNDASFVDNLPAKKAVVPQVLKIPPKSGFSYDDSTPYICLYESLAFAAGLVNLNPNAPGEGEPKKLASYTGKSWNDSYLEPTELKKLNDCVMFMKQYSGKTLETYYKVSVLKSEKSSVAFQENSKGILQFKRDGQDWENVNTRPKPAGELRNMIGNASAISVTVQIDPKIQPFVDAQAEFGKVFDKAYEEGNFGKISGDDGHVGFDWGVFPSSSKSHPLVSISPNDGRFTGFIKNVAYRDKYVSFLTRYIESVEKTSGNAKAWPIRLCKCMSSLVGMTDSFDRQNPVTQALIKKDGDAPSLYDRLSDILANTFGAGLVVTSIDGNGYNLTFSQEYVTKFSSVKV